MKLEKLSDNLTNKKTEPEEKYERLWVALDSYPYPIALFDSNDELVYCNLAYKLSMTDDPEAIKLGMSITSIAQISWEAGKLIPSTENGSTSVHDYIENSNPSIPIQDLEFAGDIHHRVVRSKTPLGDTIVTRVDATELVRERRAAQTAHRRLLAALDSYPFPFAIYDQDDCIVVWNEAYRRSMSNKKEFIQKGMHRTVIAEHAIRAGLIFDAIGKEDLWSTHEHQEDHVNRPVQDLELTGGVHHRLYRNRAPNGDLVILRVDITELVEKTKEAEENASQLEIANREILHQAEHDQLTGLANRRRLQGVIDSASTHGPSEYCGLAALAIDLDHFKLINDTLGHATGDELLDAVGQLFVQETDENDLVARVGGDEYVLFVQGANAEGRAQSLAQRILIRFQSAIQLKHGSCRVGVSIGIATTPTSEVDELLLHADIALYRAKRNGRGRIAHFKCEDLDDIQRRRDIVTDLENGISRGEFEPVFQPQIECASGRITGVEVLTRWRHPKKGLISPNQFVAEANELGLMSKIDAQIFQGVIALSEDWMGISKSPLRLSFNVSAERIRFDTESIIEGARAYPGCVCLELLENLFVEEEDEEFFRCIEQLRAAEIDLEIDDFGSGRTSIIALQRLAPTGLKIDSRIIQDLEANEQTRRLVSSIIDIGHVMGTSVTAEGVETDNQAAALKQLGCDGLQGFAFAKPMIFSELKDYLKDVPR